MAFATECINESMHHWACFTALARELIRRLVPGCNADPAGEGGTRARHGSARTIRGGQVHMCAVLHPVQGKHDRLDRHSRNAWQSRPCITMPRESAGVPDLVDVHCAGMAALS